MLYKGLKGKACIPTDDLIPKTWHGRNQHSVAFQTPIANADVYKGSFFPQLSGIVATVTCSCCPYLYFGSPIM